MIAHQKSELQLACERFEQARSEYRNAWAKLSPLLNACTAAARREIRLTPASITAHHIDCIIATVSAHHGLTRDQLLQRTRTMRIVDARQRAMFLVDSMLSPTLVQTGEFFQRDHGTVHHAILQVANRCALDRKYSADFDGLRGKCLAALENL